ncbi:radical SAM protein [Candidatus Woesearchaeota archaeon]|nr:radical SAM protein [Candidatus Woesearchaeota archaeon]
MERLHSLKAVFPAAQNIAKIRLEYDNDRWEERIVTPVRTLQLFITNRCNKRCKGCFYEKSLGRDEMPLQEYDRLVRYYAPEISKVILLGGEPTMHSGLADMIRIDQEKGLRTTIYTNGFDLTPLDEMDLTGVELRIGVLGLNRGEKALAKIKPTIVPTTIVYMLRKDNIDELMPTALYAEKNFNCKAFYISSIRDIATTGSFWKDTDETVPMDEYAHIVNRFIKEYSGGLEEIHIAKRGVLETDRQEEYPVAASCRFLNIFPDLQKILCPFDISLRKYSVREGFADRKCNKHDSCLLQKIVLTRKRNLT